MLCVYVGSSIADKALWRSCTAGGSLFVWRVNGQVLYVTTFSTLGH